MVYYCCAYNCRVSSAEGFVLHKFPDDDKLRAAWIRAIHRREFIPTKRSRLCSKHFTPESYVPLRYGFPVLKKTAVPTIFDFPSKSPDRESIKGYIQCFVPGCKSKCPNNVEKDDSEEMRNIHLFTPPRNDRLFEKWKSAICGFEKDLTKGDHVCELHFQEEEIERFYITRTSDGSIIKIAKNRPTLKSRAVPSIFLDFPEDIIKDGLKRLPTIQNPSVYNSKIRKSSLNIISESSDDSENVDVNSVKNKCIASDDSENMNDNIVQDRSVSIGKEGFTYDTVLKNLHLIKKPSNWWSIAPTGSFIICARWNEKYNANKRVVIESNLTVRVFLKEWEINITDLMDITCIDDISALLEKVESYSMNFTCP